MINLRSKKGVYIPVDEEPQPFTFQLTGVNNQVTTSTENDNPAPVGENIVALPTCIRSELV